MRYKLALTLIIFALAIVAIAFGLSHAGRYLVVNAPEKSDTVIVLAGDHNDLRYRRGLAFLRKGYGNRMLVDTPAARIYGHTYAEYATAFVAESAGENKGEISICSVTSDSTVEESADIRRCLGQILPAPHSVLLVSSDYHTRRALSIVKARLPQYHWSAAAVEDADVFGDPWWAHREWAKICFYEWEKLVWWKLFESWRKA